MEEQPNPGSQKHLLVVDDNMDLAQTYKELFQANGYYVSIAANGVLALKLILNSNVDAIVCDLSMPQLEGDMFYVTVERVRPQLGNRFIFVTGNVGHPKYEPFFEKVKCPVLYKPVSIENLLTALRELFTQPA